MGGVATVRVVLQRIVTIETALASERTLVDAHKYTKLPGLQAGIAGEYLVAGELTRRGYIASLTLRNTRGVDILASNLDATASVGIQVKTAQNTRATWLLNQNVEKQRLARNLVFVFRLVAS
jgi:hypothetical protein